MTKDRKYDALANAAFTLLGLDVRESMPIGQRWRQSTLLDSYGSSMATKGEGCRERADL
ncbi:hypothetical protein [Planctomicrobium sp. SH527]|uniref:hypothetical protein n=1 Tax=Planctomicrobium sp. SH527 TaxID=3448123 RepID=UPI003F5B4C89